MAKSIHRVEYEVLVELLQEYRERAGVTQVELSKVLGRSQSFVSDIERGQRRIDLIELRDICRELGGEVVEFVKALETKLAGRRSSRQRVENR